MGWLHPCWCQLQSDVVPIIDRINHVANLLACQLLTTLSKDWFMLRSPNAVGSYDATKRQPRHNVRAGPFKLPR